MSAFAALSPADLTLGILAGGLATRLGGMDKAWLLRDGIPQVLHVVRGLKAQVCDVMVSANRNLGAYSNAGLRSVADTHLEIGPLGGLHALGTSCATRWLLTLPVDIRDAQAGVAALLSKPTPVRGTRLQDADGLQPLVALWPVAELRTGIDHAIASGEFSVQSLQRSLGMETLRVPSLRIGNLNTMADLAAAGMATA